MSNLEYLCHVNQPCEGLGKVDRPSVTMGAPPRPSYSSLTTLPRCRNLLQPHHISHQHAIKEQGRKKKHTLRSKVIEDVQPYLEADGTVLHGNYNLVKNSLHADIVRKSTNNFKPNRVLGSKPPPIHKSERSLPRVTRGQATAHACATSSSESASLMMTIAHCVI